MKYNWDKMTTDEMEKAVQEELRLDTHNGTTKEDLVNCLLFAARKEVKKEVIKLKEISQACPVCKKPVNYKYCSNCGQKLKY